MTWDIAKEVLTLYGPLAMGWVVAAVLYRDTKKEREGQQTANAATAKALQELSIYVKALKR